MTDRALVVEDDHLTSAFLARALEAAALTTIGVRTGAQALERLRADPDLAVALIDGILPDMHGTALARRLIDEPATASIPLLFVTGALRHPIAERSGVAAMVKPVSIAQLVTQIGELRAWQRSGGSPAAERHHAVAALEKMFLVGP